MWSKADYEMLHQIVFRPDYPGYRPTVKELPNGDGKVDADKRFAHIADKYLTGLESYRLNLLSWYLDQAHHKAIEVARALNVPDAFMPVRKYGCLRVLEYPPGAGSARHTDFDLFTLLMYRDDLEHYPTWEDSPLIFLADEGEEENSPEWQRWQNVAPGLHMGELGEIIGMGKATPHEVLPTSHAQHSIVYFALPDHAARLPPAVRLLSEIGVGAFPSYERTGGTTVGAWLDERLARSRTY